MLKCLLLARFVLSLYKSLHATVSRTRFGKYLSSLQWLTGHSKFMRPLERHSHGDEFLGSFQSKKTTEIHKNHRNEIKMF